MCRRRNQKGTLVRSAKLRIKLFKRKKKRKRERQNQTATQLPSEIRSTYKAAIVSEFRTTTQCRWPLNTLTHTEPAINYTTVLLFCLWCGTWFALSLSCLHVHSRMAQQDKMVSIVFQPESIQGSGWRPGTMQCNAAKQIGWMEAGRLAGCFTADE